MNNLHIQYTQSKHYSTSHCTTINAMHTENKVSNCSFLATIVLKARKKNFWYINVPSTIWRCNRFIHFINSSKMGTEMHSAVIKSF